MEYFYGPVPSRRLGFSLGVDLTPRKTCSFDCIYCQLGKSTKTKVKRAFFLNFSKFKKELRSILKNKPKIDYITLSGSGEPTLHKNLGEIITTIKEISRHKYPVCVITNSSLLYRKKVRNELKEADLIIPSLDAPSAKIFKKINRPHPQINFRKVKEGCIKLRKEFKGKIWLEIMLLKGVNDSLEVARKFKKIVKRINPDKIQLNLPVRPATKQVFAPNLRQTNKIKDIIDENIEIVGPFSKSRKAKQVEFAEERIICYLKRRPATQEDLNNSLGMNPNEVIKCLAHLLEIGKIKAKTQQDRKHFVAND